MNNTFNSPANLQHGTILSQIQHQSQHVKETDVKNHHQSKATALNHTYLNQRPLHSQHLLTHLSPHKLCSSNASDTLLDQCQMKNSTGLEKPFFPGSSPNVAANSGEGAMVTGRFYTTSLSTHSPKHPSTILLSNNFNQQLQQQSPTISTVPISNSFNNSNLRVMSAATINTLQPPYILNIANNIGKELIQIKGSEEVSKLQQVNGTEQQNPLQIQQDKYQFLHHHSQPQNGLALQHFYIHSDETNSLLAPAHDNKISTNSTTSGSLSSLPTENPPSTVVLDHINICINNHYADSIPANSESAVSSYLTHSQQPSPIIPAIQHKVPIESNSLISNIEPYEGKESIVINDEPDSTTTTPHTPPTTPETTLPSISAATESISQSFDTSGKLAANNIPMSSSSSPQRDSSFHKTVQKTKDQLKQNLKVVPSAPPSPPSPLVSSMSSSSSPVFNIGEDVLIKSTDGRFYLGTIIDKDFHRFLVRFDDKSELWSGVEEMRKLGSGNTKPKGQLCVGCKRSDGEFIVETCERCGRGYHRDCTSEITPGNWMCKRCDKPMKMLKTRFCLDNKPKKGQLPYDGSCLNWDEKHRVNEEQIYCYCGTSGKFDHNMLQCCRCKNWFHTQCTSYFKFTILRGDGFFVFCCSICNNGQEFLRRLKINWIDFMHLVLYNLSANRKHQNQKYYHLIKDIFPFALEKKHNTSIPKEWHDLSDHEFKERITRTLKENSDRFLNGREIKKDHSYYALRHKGPPILPNIQITPNDVLNDAFITEKLKLKLFKETHEKYNNNLAFLTDDDTSSERSSIRKERNSPNDKLDVYDFRIEDEDEKFTSDDEIPIKHIIEKVKKCKTTPTNSASQQKHMHKTSCGKSDSSDYCNNSCSQKGQKSYETFNNAEKENGMSLKKKDLDVLNTKADSPSKSSRKRKAFTLSKVYKKSVNEADGVCDSSSDDNSSSSRGTSLDLIIPPPKNFLGLNNPFRVISPKKNFSSAADVKFPNVNRRATNGKNSIFTTSNLDFSSKLAALKNSGIFSNLSSSELAKAAGQPRLVRTIKRRLSAKDITIGPNQEVRRRRIRRMSSNIEVISTTTINPISNNLFNAKDFIATLTSNQKLSSTTNNNNHQNTNNSTTLTSNSSASSSSVDSSLIMGTICTAPSSQIANGRRLRQRPEKSSPNTSRRSSISAVSTSSTSSMLSAGGPTNSTNSNTETMHDLKQSVNKYFGAVNRIESGEKYSICAKRQLGSGQMQYLIEWGDVTTP